MNERPEGQWSLAPVSAASSSSPPSSRDRAALDRDRPAFQTGRPGFQRGPAAAAVILAVVSFLVLLALWLEGGGELDAPWAPSYDLRLTFRLDGLGALYSLLATGIGALVFGYASSYLPLHLVHQKRPPADAPRFWGFLVLFMAAMVGLATAQDFVLLFVFWDLTAVASYFLIGYDRDERPSREAALMALLVTGITAVLLLIAAVLLHASYGTFSLPELAERAEPGTTLTVAGVLIAVAGLAKSAQAPLHIWLPRAMAAPTPVSAYLHSAAMVAAGVFLLSRTYPLLQQSRLVLDGLLAVGLLSVATGALLALTHTQLKRILAGSTISQYGYVVFLLGLGGAKAALAAGFYVLAHAMAKCGLFLTAGAVTEATGRNELRDLGGLARSMPVLAAASAGCAAGLAALPLSIGFFKDELLFKAALERGTLTALAAVAAAALTVAYAGRLWAGIFLGPRRARPGPVPVMLVAPVVVLGGLIVLGGLVVGPFLELAEAAGAATFGAPTPGEAAYHLDLRAENLMALAAYACGGLLLAARSRLRGAGRALAGLGERAGPDRGYEIGLRALNAFSDRIHDLEVRDLRTRVAAVLVPGGALVVVGLVATGTEGYEAGAITADDATVILALLATVVAALAACVPRTHLMLVLVLSAVGFCLAVVYALLGGPDVALVAVLIETVVALLFLGVFALLPREVLRREARLRISVSRRRRDVGVALAAGISSFLLVWSALSRPSPERAVSEEHVALAEEAHAKDVVTAILADFRGLDTLVEITVVFVALSVSLALLRWRPSA